MDVLETVLDAVGDTPLVRLGKVSRGVQPTVLAKLEMLNPGGSVKDRIGLRMIEAAEREGRLKPGGTIVEPTSGNTGHGLAIAAAIRGYRCIFVMPDKMSQEKISLLRAYGAEVVICPTAVPPESPESYYRVADRLAEEIPGAFQPNQYFNPENPAAHYETTGPEIWRQTDGAIDVLVAGVGTGGTITGAARYLKEQKPDLLVVGADPEGRSTRATSTPTSPRASARTSGRRRSTRRSSTATCASPTATRSGWRAGSPARRGSWSARPRGPPSSRRSRSAAELPAGTTIVVILPDTGRNYLSKAYSDTWLLQYGLMERPEIVRVEEVLSSKHGHVPPLVTVNAHAKVRQAIDVLHEFNISQAPVVREEGVDVAQFVGASTRTRSWTGSSATRTPCRPTSPRSWDRRSAWSSSTRRSSSRSRRSSTVPRSWSRRRVRCSAS